MFNPDLFRLNHANVLITGAGAGIGRAIALTFASAGAKVFVSDRDGLAAHQVSDEINSAGGTARSTTCDVLSETSCEAAVMQAFKAFGNLTILVNNAGGGGPKPYDMPMSEMRRVFELNLFSVFRLCQLAAPQMQAAGGGAILNISSMAGENKNCRMVAYGSSKAALNHLTRNLAFDLGPMNIRVNGIAPGATRTQALDSVLTPEIETKMLSRTPLKRLGEPQDMANAALFLCSPAAQWISGQILTVSGGGTQDLD